MSIKVQKQLAVVLHQLNALQKEHSFCEEKLLKMKEENEALKAKIEDLEKSSSTKTFKKVSKKQDSEE